MKHRHRDWLFRTSVFTELVNVFRFGWIAQIWFYVIMIDTHCHLDLIEEKGISSTQSILAAEQVGVESIVQISTDLRSARYNQRLADTLSRENQSKVKVYWTVGLHPEAVDEIETLEPILKLAYDYRDHPTFLGLGETGLDYFHDASKEPLQKKAFARHIDVAEELGLPLVLHLRDTQKFEAGKTKAVQDAYDMVKDRNVSGVLHCFTYGYDEAKPFVDLGWFVSFSGIVTYKNAKVIQDAASRLPLHCILTETDAPFLSPTPVRGETNQPAYVKHTFDFVTKLAMTNGEPEEVVSSAILDNCRRFISMKNHTKKEITLK